MFLYEVFIKLLYKHHEFLKSFNKSTLLNFYHFIKKFHTFSSKLELLGRFIIYFVINIAVNRQSQNSGSNPGTVECVSFFHRRISNSLN